MRTISCKIPKESYDRLSELAEKSDRNISYIMREAVNHYMDEYEKYLIAANILAKEGKHLSVEQIKKHFASIEPEKSDQ